MNYAIKELLKEYNVNRDFQKEIRKGYRTPIQDVLGSLYDVGVNFIYGGSLAKNTANTNSCDIDLLCYVASNSKMTLKDIYKTTEKALHDKGYFINPKNSAIEVTGKLGENQWDYTVDVVPGRYINNNSKDVNLWNNRQNNFMKTNPEVQINKVRESGSKDIIRIIKLFREFNSFKFKSFFLEIFIIDVVEKLYVEGDDITDRLMHFCNSFEKIGRIKIDDPANSNNNIMDIHNDHEFSVIRNKVSTLRDAILTDDSETVRKCILGEQFDESESYENSASKHSNLIKFNNLPVLHNGFSVSGYYSDGQNNFYSISNPTVLDVGMNLKFIATVPRSIKVKELYWVICNAGYEARKASSLRGKNKEYSNETKDSGYARKYIRFESTSYHGNHYAQAVMKSTTGKVFVSNIVTVKIRK